MHESKAFAVTERPFVIVEKRPGKIAADRHPFGGKPADFFKVTLEIGLAFRIGNAAAGPT